MPATSTFTPLQHYKCQIRLVQHYSLALVDTTVVSAVFTPYEVVFRSTISDQSTGITDNLAEGERTIQGVLEGKNITFRTSNTTSQVLYFGDKTTTEQINTSAPDITEVLIVDSAVQANANVWVVTGSMPTGFSRGVII